MKLKLIVFFISLIVSVCFIHTKSFAQLHLLKDNKTCLYGFTDDESNWIIEPQYDLAEEFYGNYAVVTKNEKSGLIKTTGEIIVPIEYSSIKLDYRNFYILKKGASYFVFDSRLEKITLTNIPYPIDDYYNHCATVHIGKQFGLFNQDTLMIANARKIRLQSYNLAIIYTGTENPNNDRVELFDLKKNSFITTQYYTSINIQDSTHFIVAKNGRYGMIDRKEKIIIPFIYDSYYQYNNYTSFPIILSNSTKHQSVLYDKTGKQKSKKKYKNINYDLNDNSEDIIYIASYKNKCTLIDTSGREILPCIYDSIEFIQRGYYSLAYILYSKKGIQITDKSGKIINTGYYPNINYHKHLYAFNPDSTDEESDNPYTEEHYDAPLSEIIAIKNDSSIIWIDIHTGKEYCSGNYEETDDSWCSGIIYYKGKYGLISSDMKHILRPTYDYIFPFKLNCTYTTVLNNDLFGVIDLFGNSIIEPKYSFIEQNPFSDQSFIFQTEDVLWGIQDIHGNVIIPPNYTEITGYDPIADYCWVVPQDQSHWRIIDRNQSFKSNFQFEQPVYLSTSTTVVAKTYFESENEGSYKAGVLNCSTLEPIIPFIYADIKRVNDSVYLCSKTPLNYQDELNYYDLYIHATRIDSVRAICFLPNNTIGIKRKSNWDYYQHGKWILQNKNSQEPIDFITKVDVPYTNFSAQTESYNMYNEGLQLFLDPLYNSTLKVLADNKALELYCNAIQILPSNIENIEKTTIYNISYIEELEQQKEYAGEEDYYNYGTYINYGSVITIITSHLLTNQLAEVRYFQEIIERNHYSITRINQLYTLKNNALAPLSLADITNHLKSNALLSQLLLEKLDAMTDIQLPCADRDNIVLLATAYQFENDGIRFYYKDERAGHNQEYTDIEVLLLYSELIQTFKKAPYLQELYSTSLNR